MNECSRKEPIGSNPRRYYGFPNVKAVKRHIMIESPMIRNCIGKIKRLKKRDDIVSKSGKDYLVYFKVRKK